MRAMECGSGDETSGAWQPPERRRSPLDSWRQAWRPPEVRVALHSVVPRSVGDIVVMTVSAATGLAIWIPTQASHPRYSHAPHQDTGSPAFIWLTVGAALLLTLLFTRRWQMVVPGLVGVQLLLAPFTTPRGDNDGLWTLIVPFIAGLGVGLYYACFFVAQAVPWRPNRGSH